MEILLPSAHFSHHFVRLSFGPPLEQLDRGLDGIERLLKRASAESKEGHTSLHHAFGSDLKPHSEASNNAAEHHPGQGS